MKVFCGPDFVRHLLPAVLDRRGAVHLVLSEQRIAVALRTCLPATSNEADSGLETRMEEPEPAFKLVRRIKSSATVSTTAFGSVRDRLQTSDYFDIHARPDNSEIGGDERWKQLVYDLDRKESDENVALTFSSAAESDTVRVFRREPTNSKTGRETFQSSMTRAVLLNHPSYIKPRMHPIAGPSGSS